MTGKFWYNYTVMKKLFSTKMNSLKALAVITVLLFTITSCGSSKSTKTNKATGAKILATAKSQLGKKYKFGGVSPKTGFDCSGLAYWSHKANGITIPRMSFDQFKKGKKIKRKALKKGDLVFFTTYKKGASHVGIYTGQNSFVHSPNSNKSVEITSLKNPYWKKRYLGARRYY